MALIGVLFTPADDTEVENDTLFALGNLIPPDEEQIPLLVDKFLSNVHTKNPVLDVEQLVEHARIVATSGLRWDAWSCIVLLTAALGTVAKPFDAAVNVTLDSSGAIASWTHDVSVTPPNSRDHEQGLEALWPHRTSC